MNILSRIFFLDEDGQKFFGEGPARLLHEIESTGSLRAAACSMGMAYTKALKLVKHAETALGFPLTSRTVGGKDGGGSTLTPEGKAWLERYEAYRDACTQANLALARKFFPVTGCVIMASGLGKRFGSNKLMADFNGVPLFLRTLQATEGLFHRRVVVTRHECIAQICQSKSVDVILHSLPHRSDTIRLGLERMSDVDCCMFLPGDQPLLRRETVSNLIRCWESERSRIVRPVCGEISGAPAIFPRWAFPELLTLPEGKGGNLVIQNHPDALRTISVEDPYELMDADTPEALDMLLRHEVSHD